MRFPGVIVELFEQETPKPKAARVAVLESDLKLVLTAQLVVAWAGEGGEEPRMGWWRSDMVSEFGGQDLFERLLPTTWSWATLQAAREAARRKDVDLKSKDHDPDAVVSLFSLGFEIDERLQELLLELKAAGRAPADALPGLSIISDSWSRDEFSLWVDGLAKGEQATTTTSIGRRVSASSKDSLETQVRRLVGGLAPLTDAYPLPHFRRER